MTMILPRVETRPASPLHHIAVVLRQCAATGALAWRRWQTQRLLEAMPMEMRKDLGWPAPEAKR